MYAAVSEDAAAAEGSCVTDGLGDALGEDDIEPLSDDEAVEE